LEVNAVNGIWATWALETHSPVVWSKIACGYLIVVHCSSVMAAMARLTAGSMRTVIETCAPALSAAPTTAWE